MITNTWHLFDIFTFLVIHSDSCSSDSMESRWWRRVGETELDYISHILVCKWMEATVCHPYSVRKYLTWCLTLLQPYTRMRGKTKTEYMYPGIWVLGGGVLCFVMKFIRPTGAVAASDLAALLLLSIDKGLKRQPPFFFHTSVFQRKHLIWYHHCVSLVL